MNTPIPAYTIAPIAVPTGAVLQPEFIRLPKPGEQCPLTGLRRSQLHMLINEGKVRSISLRKRGHLRGTRLIVVDSLLGYLRGLEAEQAPATPPSVKDD